MDSPTKEDTMRTDTIIDLLAADLDYLVGGDDIAAVAAEWEATDLPVDQISDFIDAGCWTADSAAALAAVGVTPHEAGQQYRDGYPGTIGYAVANGDLTADDALPMVA
jgi:hypothetical protein